MTRQTKAVHGFSAAMPWRSGKRLPRTKVAIKRGAHLNGKGYIRISAGPWRGEYLHRVIASLLWRQTHGVPLPSNLQVHHIDGIRTHCCPENLLILDRLLHEALKPTRAKE